LRSLTKTATFAAGLAGGFAAGRALEAP